MNTTVKHKFIDELKQRSRENMKHFFNKAKKDLYIDEEKKLWHSYNSIKWVLGMDFGNILKYCYALI